MISPQPFPLEKERLTELNSYSILDTLPEEDYDNLTAIAAELCNTEISLISLLDDKRQWFKSHHNLDVTETPKEYAFCAHAINDPNNVFIVQDARNDQRFHDNPLVTGEPYVIFYAGVPLLSPKGLPLGTLCVIDHKPKLLSSSQINSLKALSKQVMNILNLRRTKLALEESVKSLEQQNEDLERFAFVAAHDLKSPLTGISQMSDMLLKNYQSALDSEGNEMLKLIKGSAGKLRGLVSGLLDYSKSESVLKEKKSTVYVKSLEKGLFQLFSYENALKLTVETSLDSIEINEAALHQILINLLTNAIKFNDKDEIVIEIGISESNDDYNFYVKDNGPGITPKYHDKIFEIFKVMTNQDRYGKTGNGIGLATIRKIIEKSGGKIWVESANKKGTTFRFNIKK